MLSLLFLGFLLGLRHALDADHFAAIAAITSRGLNARDAVRYGAAWGLGHTVTLFVFGGIVLLVDGVIPQAFASGLEMAVGVMLIVLGADVLRRSLRARLHYHVHKHDDKSAHFHAHSHQNDGPHEQSEHRHTHVPVLPMRALLVGLMHGMAGTAALVLLTLDQAESLWIGLAYIALFGVGSIVGMAAVSVVISVPLNACAKRLTWLHNGLQGAIGLGTVAVGAFVLIRFA